MFTPRTHIFFYAIICIIILYGCAALFMFTAADRLHFSSRDYSTLDTMSIASDTASSPIATPTGAVLVNNGHYVPPLTRPSGHGGHQ